MSVLQFPQRETLDQLWQRYQDLAHACIANPMLWADRRHQEALMRAHKRYSDALLAEDSNVEAG